MLQKTLINGIDVSSKLINFEVEFAYGDAINQCEINLVKNISELISIETGQTVKVYRGWVTYTDEIVFDGYIESFEPEAGKIKVIAKDKLWDLIRKEVTHTYDSTIDASAGKISAIFEDLVETYGGLTASVQDSGTGILIEKFVCNHTNIFDRCKYLAKILDWQFYYRPDTNLVYFEPKGFTTNSNSLTVGDNVYQIPKWTYDNTEMVNDLTVVGAYQEIETTELGQIGVTSGYTTTGVTLSFTPISVKVYGDANTPPTTLKTGGLPDSTTTYNYYVDKNQKKIIPAEGTTFTTNHYYEIRYSHAVPIPVHMSDQPSIDKYGSFTKTVTYTDVRSVSDAENRGANYLVKYSQPFIYTTLKVRNSSTYSLKIGNLVSIVDNVSTPKVNQTLVITRLRIRYPADYDELVVGDKTWRITDWQTSVEERLKRINEDELANQDITTELVTINNALANQIKLQPRYFKTITQTADGTTLIWGLGIWGTGLWGTDAFGSEVLNSLQQYNNTYEETFVDEDFKGTCSATWDTTNNYLEFY